MPGFGGFLMICDYNCLTVIYIGSHAEPRIGGMTETCVRPQGQVRLDGEVLLLPYLPSLVYGLHYFFLSHLYIIYISCNQFCFRFPTYSWDILWQGSQQSISVECKHVNKGVNVK